MMERSLKIALVFPGAVDGLGGAEVQALHFLNGCDDSVVNARLVLLGNNPTFETRVADSGFDAVDVLNQKNRHPWHPAVVREYIAYLRNHAFDLVHLYGLRHEIMTRPATRHAGSIRTVSAIRGLENQRGYLHVALNRLTSRWVDLWIANSEESKALFGVRDGLPVDRIKVVANGVTLPVRADLDRQRQEMRRELGCTENDRVVICVANHFPEKRIADLVEGVKALRLGAGRCVLFVAGRFASATPGLLEMAASAEGRVQLLGYREDVLRLLAAADVMALVSESEGMPTSVLEGMAAGLPVVATPVASLVTLVRDGYNGFIVPVGDVAAITDRLKLLCDDAILAAKFGAQGRQIVMKEYSIEKMVRKTTDLYLKVCEGPTS